MKILHINANYTGSALHKAMIDGLQAHCDNRVFVPTYDPNKSVVPIGDHVLVSQCFRKWDRILFAYKQRKIIKNIESSYEISDFDMLHGYTLFSDGNVAYTLHKKYGIPYVVAVRNTDVNSFFKYRPHLRGRGVRILRNAAAVFFLSASYRDQVIEHYVPKKYREEIMGKAQIIPNAESRVPKRIKMKAEILNILSASLCLPTATVWDMRAVIPVGIPADDSEKRNRYTAYADE